ncbi:O-methyltransferase [Nesterenkonia lacusekhoensis]|uniref:O-methyltransferase YrrM n=1 Tax=Nesterenkonia lacusekhoensis TaxID=150832 RepID=A0ABS4T4G9_9MICC|nr:O-methyltransferase [Nesterenkonia lacusekhoensis]MBP2318773.1 putative O-methyltransferase YrrM [Nesterenkonia lacusekhoensis]
MTTANEQQWAAVDAYVEQTVVRQDEVFDRVRRRADEAGMPRIEVSAAHGKMLALLAEISGARRVLEVGTLAGFSTIWMARAVGDQGQVITCEYEPRHAEVAQANLEDAGVADRVQIRLGAAEDSLRQLIAEEPEPFDLVFLDADKAGNARYLQLAVQMARPGTVIVGDNVVRGGQILDADSQDPDIRGIWDFLEAQGSSPVLEATAVQTVGAKGWDGFSLAVVRSA